jgi:hypothetical protein
MPNEKSQFEDLQEINVTAEKQIINQNLQTE